MIGTQCAGRDSARRGLWTPSAQRSSAVALFIVLAALDLFVHHVNFAVLFGIPLLLLLRRAAKLRYVWLYVTLAVATLYAIYAVKQIVFYGRDPSVLLTYRIFNRTYIAITMALLGFASQAWLYWQRERSLNHFDSQEDDEVNTTAAVIACIGLGLLITAIDLVSPANFNVPVLSIVPLYLISWLQNRRALWITAGVLIALTWVGHGISPAAVETGFDHYILVNRLLVSLALFLQALILTWRIHCDQRDASY